MEREREKERKRNRQTPEHSGKRGKKNRDGSRDLCVTSRVVSNAYFLAA
jgi:hypothetical protein